MVALVAMKQLGVGEPVHTPSQHNVYTRAMTYLGMFHEGPGCVQSKSGFGIGFGVLACLALRHFREVPQNCCEREREQRESAKSRNGLGKRGNHHVGTVQIFANRLSVATLVAGVVPFRLPFFSSPALNFEAAFRLIHQQHTQLQCKPMVK